MTNPTSTAVSIVVSLRRHADNQEMRLLKTARGNYCWELDGSKRTTSTEHYPTFFGAMVAANAFMEGRRHDCRRLRCQGWLLGASLRAALAPPAAAEPVATQTTAAGAETAELAGAERGGDEPAIESPRLLTMLTAASQEAARHLYV